MLKEKVGPEIKLSRGDIFVDGHSFVLTDIGSRLEGLRSMKRYVETASNSISKTKLVEWQKEIDNKFKEVGELLGLDIHSGEREDLIGQHEKIVFEGTRLVKFTEQNNT